MLPVTANYEPLVAATVSDDELKQHFTTFKSFDLDESGFISPASLKQIMDTLEIQVTAEQARATRCGA